MWGVHCVNKSFAKLLYSESINSVLIFISYFYMVHLSIILLFKPISSKCNLPFIFYNYNIVCTVGLRVYIIFDGQPKVFL
jgi:hypothetical protein